VFVGKHGPVLLCPPHSQTYWPEDEKKRKKIARRKKRMPLPHRKHPVSPVQRPTT